MKGDIIKNCQVKKGKNGQIEQYKEKKDDDIFKTKIIFRVKPIIKKYNKEDIKIDKNYISCEKKTVEEIVPDVYEDENNDGIIDDEYLRDLASSLRSSIDKSTNMSINMSLQQSYNQSYADGIYDSLHGSNMQFSSGKGLLNRMKQVFRSSVEVHESNNDLIN